jgi:DNA-directed RNA polymerase specialized sigma24 family protein
LSESPQPETTPTDPDASVRSKLSQRDRVDKLLARSPVLSREAVTLAGGRALAYALSMAARKAWLQ